MKTSRAIAAALLAPVSLAAVPALGQPIGRMGAIGDSLSDEYLEQSYGSYAEGWTEILSKLRGIDFGPTADDAGVGFWGEPRRDGFQDNWARFGDTVNVDDSDSTSAITRGQHTGLRDGILNRGVTHVVMFIGGNDMSPFHGPYADVYNGNWTQQQINDYVEAMVVDVEFMLDTIDVNNVKILLCNSFDFSDMPRVERDFPDVSGRLLASEMYNRYDVRLRQVAADRGLPYLDMLALNRAIFGTPGNETSELIVAGVSIDVNDGLQSNAATAFVADDVHPRSVIQGIWANAILTGLNLAYGTNVPLLNESEIIINGDLTPTGPDALDSQIGDLAQYITLPMTMNTEPDVTIAAPIDGSSFTEGDSIGFSGSAIDAQDGDLSADLDWTSSLDGLIGTGAAFASSSLSVGQHTITASVMDTGNLTTSETVSITVEGLPAVCLADTNGDGMLNVSDFNAWILAYNNDAPACDQNGDGQCLQNDFSAWVLNFNTGC
ncbi:MAG: GC-type dockerin domain-anchored protein [Planctomycetota bacterium]